MVKNIQTIIEDYERENDQLRKDIMAKEEKIAELQKYIDQLEREDKAFCDELKRQEREILDKSFNRDLTTNTDTTMENDSRENQMLPTAEEIDEEKNSLESFVESDKEMSVESSNENLVENVKEKPFKVKKPKDRKPAVAAAKSNKRNKKKKERTLVDKKARFSTLYEFGTAPKTN